MQIVGRISTHCISMNLTSCQKGHSLHVLPLKKLANQKWIWLIFGQKRRIFLRQLCLKLQLKNIHISLSMSLCNGKAPLINISDKNIYEWLGAEFITDKKGLSEFPKAQISHYVPVLRPKKSLHYGK